MQVAPAAHILLLGAALEQTLQGLAHKAVKAGMVNIPGFVGGTQPHRSRKAATNTTDRNELGCVAMNSDLAP